MLNYLERFKNTGTIISLVGFIGLLLNQFGLNVDLQWLNATINIVCSILVILGICNNPHTSGLDIPTTKNTEEKIAE